MRRASRDPLRAFRLPCDDDRWDCFETRKGQRADDPQTEPANSHPPGLATTMRMGGPTIQLPAADARCTLRSLSPVQYMRLTPSARPAALQRCSGSCWSAIQHLYNSRRAKAARVPLDAAAIDPTTIRSSVRWRTFPVRPGSMAARRSRRRLGYVIWDCRRMATDSSLHTQRRCAADSLWRALLHRPELLFLDEPTAALNPVRRPGSASHPRGSRGGRHHLPNDTTG